MDKSPWEGRESYNVNDPLPGLDPTAQSTFAGGVPPVVKWYKVYCGLMIVCYFAGMIGGAALVAFRNSIPPTPDANLSSIEFLIRGVLLALMCFVMFVGNVAALVLPPKPWTWIYHLVNIGLGLTGCCFFITIPLIIYWLKPETQFYFGRTPAGMSPPGPTAPPPIPPV